MPWEKVLTVNSGKVWLHRTGAEGQYKVTGLADCETEEQEPFKVWFEKVDYEPGFPVPQQDTGFFVNTYVSAPARALKLKARRDPAGDIPKLFRKFCTLLVDPPEGQEAGYIFSTGDLLVRTTHEPTDQGERLAIHIGEPEWEHVEGNFVWFAHYAQPFTLIPDPGKLDLKGIPSADNFADILRDFYGWPLGKE